MRLLEQFAYGFFGCITIGSVASLPILKPESETNSWTSRRVTYEAPVDDSEHSVQSQKAAGNESSSTSETNGCSLAEANLRLKIDLLERGEAYLRKVADYTATLTKREFVGRDLLDEEILLIKCRHQPFSVYLLWETGDTGREVLFVEGTNDGRLIAHDGGWKSRIPAFSLSPDCALAMRDTRYPVTKAGLLGLIETMLGFHRDDLQRSNIASCELDASCQFDGRPCVAFTTKYQSKAASPQYRKSVTFIDQEWNIPVHTQHFEWPNREESQSEDKLDEATLVESYSFTQIKMKCGLTDSDFDRHNPEYHFR